MRKVMRGNLLVFTLGDALRSLSMFVTFPFFSLYVRALGGSTVDIGVVNGLRPLLALFVYPLAGYLSDRYNRVKIITATSYASAALWLPFLLASDWRMLALGNILQGLTTFYFPAANSLMADSVPAERRGVAYALWMAIPGAVGILPPYAAGYLITAMGIEAAMRLLYALTMVLTLVIAVMNHGLLREPRRSGPGEGRVRPLKVLSDSYTDMVRVLREMPPRLRAFAAVLIVSSFFGSLVGPFWVIHVVDHKGLTEIQWGAILLASAVVGNAMLVPAGLIVDRLGVGRVLPAAMLLTAAPILMFPFVSGMAETALILAALTAANSFLISGAPTLMAELAPLGIRGRVMAALGQGMISVNARGGGVGGPGMGALLTIPAVAGSSLGGFVYLLSPALLWMLLGASMAASSLICFSYVSRPAVASIADGRSPP